MVYLHFTSKSNYFWNVICDGRCVESHQWLHRSWRSDTQVMWWLIFSWLVFCVSCVCCLSDCDSLKLLCRFHTHTVCSSIRPPHDPTALKEKSLKQSNNRQAESVIVGLRNLPQNFKRVRSIFTPAELNFLQVHHENYW